MDTHLWGRAVFVTDSRGYLKIEGKSVCNHIYTHQILTKIFRSHIKQLVYRHASELSVLLAECILTTHTTIEQKQTLFVGKQCYL